MPDEEIIGLWRYNLETVVAEKMETILSRGILNTRMRDLYDLYLLFSWKFSEMKRDIIKEAFYNTAESRKTLEVILVDPDNILLSIKQDPIMKRLWASYQANYSFAKEVGWTQTIHAVKTILKIITTMNP